METKEESAMQFVLNLKVAWTRYFKWSVLILVCVGVFAFMAHHMPSVMPDTGFETAAEYEQFDKLAAAETASPSVVVSGIGVLPMMFALLFSVGKLVEVRSFKRYVVISQAVATSCSATIGIKADGSMVDTLGHVNYLATASNFDCCREAVMNDVIGWPMEVLRHEHEMAFMVAHAGFNYRRQIKKGDTILIHGKVSQTSRVKIEIDMELRVADQSDQVAADGKLIMPLVSFKTGKAISIPEWIWKNVGGARAVT